MSIIFSKGIFELYQFVFSVLVLFGLNFNFAQEVHVIDRKGTEQAVRNNQVFYLQNGAALSLISAPLEGDELFYSDTGLAGGAISVGFIYDGDNWVLRSTNNAVPLWISNTTGGTYLGNDIINFNGVLYTNITATNTDTSPNIDATNWEVSSPIKAYGKIKSNGNADRIFGATVNRTSTGLYRVTLTTARSTRHYTINLTVEESENSRDDINISVSDQSSSSFDVIIHEGDNGQGPNSYINRDWYFSVMDF